MAKRISLREFQEGLVQRLTSAQRGEAQRALLGMQSGRDLWVLDLTDGAEIVPLPDLKPVPLTKPWFAGIANIRGTLYAVVDFSAFCGGEPTVRAAEARLLLPHARYGINCALLMTRALGLRNPDELETRGATDCAPAWVGEEYDDAQGRTWKRMNLRALVTDPGFLDVSA
jgi:twitching motility protein PilI